MVYLIIIILVSLLIIALMMHRAKIKEQSFKEYFMEVSLFWRLVIGIILGWCVSFIVIWLLEGCSTIDEDGFRLISFIAFPMGVIIGGGFVLALNKKSNNKDLQHPQNSKYQQLAQLKNLLDSGAITQEEYDAEKKELLQTK